MKHQSQIAAQAEVWRLNRLYTYKEFYMSFDLIIKNGTVILENESRVVDIAVRRQNRRYR
jgi:hypothetical protein